VRESSGTWVGPLVAGAGAPPRETEGNCALAPVIASGAARVMVMVGSVALEAAWGTAGDGSRSLNEPRHPRVAVGDGVWRGVRKGGVGDDWEEFSPSESLRRPIKTICSGVSSWNSSASWYALMVAC
jgi:hypothetical protein